ncbi:MAG: alkylation repair enzyme protein [Candidatus Wolfebacteria bacterium GW2011_GWA2_47_9b]|uniref:Alkylation repair enzyme protein n=1 Tax=Candidatus Wolfebacteria bacterium GW2011_GWA2_47_9b TaxID=1619005 RepID=A0A0G1U5X3_9BACT|nr:MAG: alkylation repair enzyme protein [Candidatus Wolfebacteria bacterium GW2011_GWA2_47_9b]
MGVSFFLFFLLFPPLPFSLVVFKPGPGEYAEGDQFMGIAMPDVRKVVVRFRDLDRVAVLELLHSPWHEERMAALLILVDQYKRGDAKQRKAIYTLYLKNTNYINNWDLIDLTAGHIVGAEIVDGGADEDILLKLVRSRSVWDRRIAMLATFYPIYNGDAKLALTVAEFLVDDSHDLIHKAVGWMLREVGKRCSVKEEEAFLDLHAATMPRTMLRYALEHFPSARREYYMGMKIVRGR